VRDRQAIKKRSLHNERCRVFAGMTAVKFRKPMNTRISRSQKTKEGGGGGGKKKKLTKKKKKKG